MKIWLRNQVSLIIDLNYTDMKLSCRTESGLNLGTLIGLKMQLMVEIYHLLGGLNGVFKQVVAGLLLFKSFVLEITYNFS